MTSKRLAGPGFIILNVLRAMNITGLLAVIVASLIMVIKTFTASKVCRTSNKVFASWLDKSNA
jgi:hypothetical protein